MKKEGLQLSGRRSHLEAFSSSGAGQLFLRKYDLISYETSRFLFFWFFFPPF